MLRLRLVDIWRQRNPGRAAFTHVATSRTSAGRLDRILVSSSGADSVTRDGFIDGLPGDHRGVLLHLTPHDGVLRGTGGWCLPTHFLSDSAFLRRVRSDLRAYCAAHPVSASSQAALFLTGQAHPPPPVPVAAPPPPPPPLQGTPPASTAPSTPPPTFAPRPRPLTAREHWDGMVDTIFVAGQQHAAHRRHSAGQERAALVRAAQQAAAAAAAPGAPPDALLAYADAQRRLQEHGHHATRLAAARASVIDRDFAEAPTFHFHATHGRGAPEDRLIRQLGVPGTNPDAPPRTIALTDHAGRCDAADAIASFYSSDSPDGLFRPGEVDAAAQRRMLDALDARLAAELAASCEGVFSPSELRAALATLPRAKSPGSDGLPYELYTALWDVLGQPMCDAFNEAFACGSDGMPSLTSRQRTGTIVLLFKGNGQDRQLLGSYRPITLFNTDLKIAAKALARRMAHPLSTVVDITQTAFLPNRWIGDNLFSHLEEIDYAAATNVPGAIVLLDYAKAFDRLHRGWLAACMAALGFGPDARRWVSVFLAGSIANVAFNGWFSPTFPTAGGVGQGSPLSPLLYVLAAQPLAAQARLLQRQGRIVSLLQPDGSPAPPTHQHADDTSLHASTPADIAVLYHEAVMPFCAASGARINVSKTHGLLIGSAASLPDLLDSSTGIKYSSAPRRHLGLPIGSNTSDALLRMQRDKVASISHAIVLWSRHSLSYIGRVYVARQCLLSKLAYAFTFVQPDAAVLRDIRAIVEGYVQSNRLVAVHRRKEPSRGLPSRAVATLPLSDGGLRYPDLANAPASLRLKYVTRLLEPANHPWKAIARQWFGRGPAWLAAHPDIAPRPVDKWGLGLSTLVSTFPIGQEPGIPPRVLAAVAAFQSLQPHRLRDPAAAGPHHVLQEPLFYNRQIRDGRRLPLGGEHWLEVAEAGIRRVGDLQRALAAGPTGRSELPTIAAALPEAWREIVSAPPPLVPPHAQPVLPAITALLSPGASRVAVHRPGAGAAPDLSLYTVSSDARLQLLPTVPPPPSLQLHLWSPCLVLQWDPSRPWRRQPPHVPHAQPAAPWFLVGDWQDVSLDPAAWGCGSVPLHQLTARVAAQRLRVLHLLDISRRGYVAGQPLRPDVWEDDWADAGSSQGVRRIEAKWEARRQGFARDAADRRRELADAGAASSRAAWMDPAPPRPSPADRGRARAERSTTATPRTPREPPDDTVDAAARQHPLAPWRGVWQALHDRHIPREHREIGWRVLHAALHCPARRAAYDRRVQASCQRPSCGGAAAGLTHIFGACTLASAVVAWLCDVWAAIEPTNRPPATFAVIAAGDTRQWQTPHRSLWLRLRLRLLHELWRVSAAEDAIVSTPASAIASRIVAGAAADMRLDWLRARLPAETLAEACGTWMTGSGPRLTPATATDQFGALWCPGDILCRLPVCADTAVPDIRWTASWPVPFPGRPPDSAHV